MRHWWGGQSQQCLKFLSLKNTESVRREMKVVRRQRKLAPIVVNITIVGDRDSFLTLFHLCMYDFSHSVSLTALEELYLF